MARYAVAGAFAVIGFIIGGGPQGAMLGWSIGSVIGGLLFPEKQKPVLGPRLQDGNVQVSTFGTPIPWVWGNYRTSGNIIWMTKIVEVMQRVKTSGGGKGGSSQPKQYEFTYYGNFSVAICKGPIAAVWKIWADGKLVWQYTRAGHGIYGTMAGYVTVHLGDETQTESALMAMYDGAGKHPAYRGIAYVDIGPMCPLKDYGNRIPQLSFEVSTALTPVDGYDTGTVTLDTIVSDICVASGLQTSDIDVTELAPYTVNGFGANNQSPARAVLEPLQTVWLFDGIESDGKVKFHIRSNHTTPVLTATDTDLAVSADKAKEDTYFVQDARQQDVDIASKVVIKFINPGLDYEQGAQYYQRLNATQWAQQEISLEVPVVLDNTTALEVGKQNLFNSWVMRTNYEWSLPLWYSILDPGDVVTLSWLGKTADVYITEMTMGGDGVIQYKGAGISSITYVPGTDTGVDPGRPPTDLPGTDDGSGPGTGTGGSGGAGDMVSIFIDGPLVDASEDVTANSGFLVTSHQTSTTAFFAGGVLYSSPDDTTYDSVTTVPLQGITGVTSTVLPAPDSHVGSAIFDMVSTVRVTLHMPVQYLTSVSKRDVLNGSNFAFIQTTSGWELIGFMTAIYVSDGVYDLSGLWRGLQGSEWTMGDHATGKSFVIVDGSSLVLAIENVSWIGTSRYYKSVPFGAEIDPITPVTFTNHQISWKPLAPCHGRAKDYGTNDMVLTWEARPRTNYELRNNVDTSSDEAVEQYKVEIYDSGYTTLKRTLTSAVGERTVLYTRAMQITDFGGVQNVIHARIYSWSSRVGWGYPYQYDMPVTLGSSTVVPGLNLTRAENLFAFDTVTASGGQQLTVAETGAATDTVGVSGPLSVSISESANATDQSSAVSNDVAEHLNATDTQDTTTSGGNAQDQEDATVTKGGVVAETLVGIAAQDAIVLINLTVNETGAASDAITVATAYAASVTESGTSAETITAGVSFASTGVTESGSASDTTNGGYPYSGTVMEGPVAASVTGGSGSTGVTGEGGGDVTGEGGASGSAGITDTVILREVILLEDGTSVILPEDGVGAIRKE